MKIIGKRVLAILCTVVLIVSMVLTGNVQKVQAVDDTTSARKTKVVSYTNAVPGTAPTDIPEGYVFAGWFQKEDCADELTTQGTGYAKFVDENILRVKAQITGDATAEYDTVDIRFVTSVDTLQYRDIGFEITINGKTKKIISSEVYTELYAVKTTGGILSMTPADSFCQLSQYFSTATVYGVPNVSFGTVITARACWTTQDGTLVYGELAKKTIHMGIFQTEAVDYGMILDYDNKDYLSYDAGTVSIDIEDYKEGAGALSLTCTQSDTNLLQFSKGEMAVDISDYSDGYLHFWLYIEDIGYLNEGSVVAELSSGGAKDVEEVQWTLPTLIKGWNEICLPFADATATGKIDYEAIDYFGLTLSSACQTGLIIKLDDLRAVSNGQIFSCDSLEYYAGSDSAISLTADHYKEGIGALQCANAESVSYQLARSNSPVDISEYSNGRIYFWFYVNDRSYLGTSNLVATLSSSTMAENEALQWNIKPSEVKSGWNRIALPIADADEEIGTIDLTEVVFFRLSHIGADSELVTAIDGVRAVKNEAQLIQTNQSTYETKDVVIADYIPTEMGYTVDPTGVADSTVGIQAALKDCFETGGGTVYLPEGTYKISGTIDIPAFVTLRGAWQDPDSSENLKCGTIISVEMDEVDETTASQTGVFQLHSSSGAVGLTVYYPNQSIQDVIVYPYTFYVGTEDVITELPTVRNVTVINGYRGIGASTASANMKHESLQIENFKGTFLKCGIELYHSTDVGTVQNVYINSSYWSKYDGTIDQNTLETYIKANATGMRLGDVEWTEYANIYIEGYNIGVQTVTGVRESTGFIGSFYDLYISNCVTGLQVDALDSRGSMNVARGSIEGSTYGVRNNTDYYIQLCDVEVTGGCHEQNKGSIVIDSAELSAKEIDYTDSYVKPDERILIANLTEESEKDASSKLQRCLNWMAKAGGGVVYVPGGIYSFYEAVTVPAGVELRGSSTVATRDEDDACEGTLFLCYYGDEKSSMTNTAFITLSGENSGVNGVRITYANNGPYLTNTNTTLGTSYAIRGKATGVYVVNSMIVAAAYGVDFSTCDNHYIRGVNTTCYYNTYYLGGTGGTISACLQNPTVLARTAAPVSDTFGLTTNGMFGHLLYKTMKMYSHYIIMENATDEVVYNNFTYGVMTMLTNIDSVNTNVVNLGTDYPGASSAEIVMDGGSMSVVNILRQITTEENLGTQEGQYLQDAVVCKAYKYIAGDLEMRNRLNLLRTTEGEKSEKPVLISDEGIESTGSSTLLSCDDVNGMDVESDGTFEVTTTGAFKTTGAGVVRFSACLDTPVNLAQYEKGKLVIRLYVDDVSNFTSSSPLYVEISSSRRCDCEELQWAIPVSELETGWNKIVLDMEEATSTGIIHLGAIDYIRIFHTGNSDTLVTIVDNIFATNQELNFEDTTEDDYIWSEWQ